MKKVVNIETRKFKMLLRSNPRKLGKICSILDKYIELYNTSPAGYERARLFNYLVDDNIEKAKLENTKLARKIHCFAGCSLCCYLSVAITKDEGLSILKYCNEKKISCNFHRLERQTRAKAQGNWHNLLREDKACIFLDNDSGRCKIYEVRPNTCRNHLILNTDKYCDVDSKEKVTSFMPFASIIIANATLRVVACSDMATMLMELFNDGDY